MSEAAPATGGQGAAALAATPPPTVATPAATPAADWTSTLEELDRGYVQNKGWKEPNDVLKSYRSLEALKGVPPERLLKLPEKDDAPEWGDVYGRLGRPEKPEDYGIDVGDPEYASAVSKVMHETGVSKKQAHAIIKADSEYRVAKATAEQAAFEVADKAEIESLRAEWGAGAEGQIEIGRRFAKQMGLDAGTLGKLNAALGSKGLLKLMAKAGAGLGEHEFAGSGGAGKFGMTPEAAKSRMADLKGDAEWVAKYLNGDASAKSEMEKLTRFANGIA